MDRCFRRIDGSRFARHIGLVVCVTQLLDWYDQHKRDLPWRRGEVDPWHVLLTETLLQQTTVATVLPHHPRFLERFPTAAAMAAAGEEEVLRMWAGLGYYARARRLHAAAQVIAARGFPADIDGLRALPGVGAYTAAAVGAIGFGLPAVPVDGNVERVMARVARIEIPLPRGKAAIRAAAARIGQQEAAHARPGDVAQALFDLGATVCTPVSPRCPACPWRDGCAGRDIAQRLPVRAPKKPRARWFGVHFLLEDAAGRVLLRRRPREGVLGGMMELPGTSWRPAEWTPEEALALAPAKAVWRPIGTLWHGFTHAELEITLMRAAVARISAPGELVPAARLGQAGLPSVMLKCVRLAGLAEGPAP
ncbi:MAG: A/G-specific adenine glycosylase [Rhodospirillales bacterium]|nr:A/G-specific adenine glycosylase [Rhodospirillales bacterium]